MKLLLWTKKGAEPFINPCISQKMLDIFHTDEDNTWGNRNVALQKNAKNTLDEMNKS